MEVSSFCFLHVSEYPDIPGKIIDDKSECNVNQESSIENGLGFIAGFR